MFDRKKVLEYRDAIVGDLQALIAIPSVKGDPAPGAPFGSEARRALDFMLERGAALGFEARNVDGYAGHVQHGRSGPIVGVLNHLDVVPAGEGWEHEPFGGEIDDGRVYGRGASDNKGPAVASLYCLRALADQIPDPGVRIRVIYGTNEESGFGCMMRYLEQEPVPDLGFSPDAGYPLYNREMGIASFILTAPRAGDRVVQSAGGGEALNMVPAQATAVIAAGHTELARRVVARLREEEAVEPRVRIDDSGRELRLIAEGVAAHGGRPAGGVNAIAHLVRAITAIAGEAGADCEPALRALDRLIGFETRGESAGLACRDEESGDLSLNWGTITVDDEKVEVGVNIRYPVTADYARITSVLTCTMKRAGFSVREESHLAPLFLAADDPLIETLLGVYRSVTGDETEPMSMAGGTYARVLRGRGVTFGAGFSGDNTRAHQSDEFINMDSLMRHAEICSLAMHELAEVARQGPAHTSGRDGTR